MSETSSRVRLMANLQAAVAEAVSGTMEERGRGFASDREAWAELKECIERTKQMHTDIEKVHRNAESANGGHTASEVVHVTAKTYAALFGFGGNLLHLNSYVISAAFRTDHTKPSVSNIIFRPC